MTSDVAIDADVSTDAEAPHASPRAVVRQYLDVVLLLIVLVPAIELGAPALGYELGAGGWILTRWLAVYDRRWTGRAADPVKRLAINLFEAFARIWLLAGVIVLAAFFGERQDGLTAAVVILAAYSVAFVIRLLSGPPGKKAAA
ncbi:MAG TPA: hypothetical protein VMZ00_06930 [Sporichthya sp.]|nr:hypothetical protein [Sporichthya sp.]